MQICSVRGSLHSILFAEQAFASLKSVLRKFRINEMRFRIQSSNLMLWRANAYDLDPEFQITDINYTIDRTMPVGQGAVTIGLNVKF